ncbi:hypothetical protein NPIL_419381 [Nephila pilipes]|uniref:Uncharacterized protein n=1 Tax=Nephila pilipes TaxID=299642 RepID=A0A8X6QRI5_NEPPI|nr:hypothetical protein NPIL_419381 [Nephila pilipes]
MVSRGMRPDDHEMEDWHDFKDQEKPGDKNPRGVGLISQEKNKIPEQRNHTRDLKNLIEKLMDEEMKKITNKKGILYK